jgi:hypothetical protein
MPSTSSASPRIAGGHIQLARRFVSPLFFVIAFALAVPALAAATPYKVKNLTAVSGPSPFAAGCPGALSDATNITNRELETAIAVNPADPRNIVATWKQDVGPFDGTRSDLIGTSRDGGKTWERRTIPGLGICTGGAADSPSDPWIAAGGDGTFYFGGLAASLATEPPTTAVVASRSADGGRSWAVPATVAAPLQGNEQSAVTGSPTHAGHAYAVWANFVFDFLGTRTNTVEFSRTTDGGATWSAPVLIDETTLLALDQAPKILVLPDGTLLAEFARADFSSGIPLGSIQVARSMDEGRTWQPAVQASSKAVFVFQDEFGEELPQPGYPSAAVGPDGAVYIAFEDSQSPSSGAVGLLRSLDSGRSWKAIALPAITAFAFEPAVAVDSHGTVGVTWYDLRNDRIGDAALTADVWFAASDDRGESWGQSHVAGPTDLRVSPLPSQNRVGEYQGLAPLRRGFAAIFTLGAPQARSGVTDIFFARIGPGCGDDGGEERGC